MLMKLYEYTNPKIDIKSYARGTYCVNRLSDRDSADLSICQDIAGFVNDKYFGGQGIATEWDFQIEYKDKLQIPNRFDVVKVRVISPSLRSSLGEVLE